MEDYLAEGSKAWMEIYLPFKSRLTRNRIPNGFKKNPSYKEILIHFEEPMRSMAPPNQVLKMANEFDLIFTSDRSLTKKIPHAHFSPLAECWTNGSVYQFSEDRTDQVKEKEFSVSYLMTAKNNFPTYQIRHDIWNRRNEITIPKNFWNSGRNPAAGNEPKLPKTEKFYADKIILYKSTFNICPENFFGPEENFSQRLIDCFINRTIPIYKGFDGIRKHFNLEGMIIVNSAEDAIKKINKLTPDYYNERSEEIEDNYNRVIKGEYNLSPGMRIERRIRKIYDLPLR